MTRPYLIDFLDSLVKTGMERGDLQPQNKKDAANARQDVD